MGIAQGVVRAVGVEVDRPVGSVCRSVQVRVWVWVELEKPKAKVDHLILLLLLGWPFPLRARKYTPQPIKSKTEAASVVSPIA